MNEGGVWGKNDSFTVELGFDLPVVGGTVSSVGFEPGYGFSFPTDAFYRLFLFHWPFGGSFLCDREHDGGASESPLDYEIVGSQGERIVKVQWENAGFRWDMDSVNWQGAVTPTFSDWIDFQFWFYEADGRIEIHFGPRSILNPDSYLEFNRGPWPIFWIRNYWMDLYGDPNNPSINWFDPWGSWNRGSFSGIPNEGTVLIFNPDFLVSTEPIEAFEDEVSVHWSRATQELLFDFKDTGESRGQVAIYSITGQTLFTGELSQNQRCIKVGHLPEGILIIKFIVNNRIITKQVLNSGIE
ncbi:MAG: T9SS type A sorting domain-containing protein [Bacteroidota bacterium]|nr:T9SS type A sorting domain-containing protein [Bacteroidota bacterium]